MYKRKLRVNRTLSRLKIRENDEICGARAHARDDVRLIRGPREDSSVSIASGEHRSSPSCVTIFERRSTVDSTENYYYYYYCQNGSGMWVGGK